MHQGLTTKILICLVLLFSIQANSQLNNSNDIIETIEDIDVQDDTPKKPQENPNKPKYDEEFGQEEIAPKPKAEEPKEENIAEPEESEVVEPEEEKEVVDKNDLPEEKQNYQEELEKNANQNRIEKKEISPEDAKSFEVDPVPVQEPAEPVVQSPQEQKPKEVAPLTPEEEIIEEAKALPETPVPLQEELEEAVPAPVVEEEGAPIEYAPEPTGPAIVYENEKVISPEERAELSEATEVEIEEDPYLDANTKTSLTDYMKPFKERRPRWTVQFELGSSQYEPTNLADIEVEVPMSGLGFDFKRNFSWGAMSFGFSGSYFGVTQGDADIAITIPSVRTTIYLDNINNEPYWVPYATFGYSYMMYTVTEPGFEDLSDATDNFYAGLGVMFQLDWLDPVSDVSAYQDAGIENTFVFAEARTYLDQGIMRAEEDADFSATMYVAGGIKLEF